jgi:uncharacterized protein DUF326
MTDIGAILNAYPGKLDHVDRDAFILFVEECGNCALACVACADACLAEPDRADLARCVGAALSGGDIAATALTTVSRQSSFDAAVVRAVLQACVEACRACYDECRKHALTHEHCRVCGEACNRCARACRDLLATVGLP